MKISFAVPETYVPDLSDDFMVNEELHLYEFLDNDPVRAFWLGIYIRDWIEKVGKARYLYSKEARHNNEGIQKYDKQIEYWTDKFTQANENPENNLVELAEYIMNNIFWEEENEEIDKVKMAFFFGNIVSKQLEDNKNESTEKAVRS